MKFFNRITAISLLMMSMLHAQDAKPDAKKAELAPFQQQFLNLPEEKRQEFGKAYGEAQRYFQDKRIFEALGKLNDAQKIFKDSPEVYNLIGACQVEFRAFDKAMAAFREADKLTPNQPSILFNIAEIHFVTKKWKESEAGLKEVIKLVGDDPKQVQLIRLAEFKIFLCELKQGNKEEAKKLGDKYDFMDDSPYSYYVEAVLAYDKGDSINGDAAIQRAMRIYKGNPNDLSSWQDTMTEMGYIKGSFGGDAVPDAAPAD
jgi:tetratricopeptide (TPR) repeat protein